MTMFVDECLPVYDVSDAVATVVDADVATTWDALMEVDLIEVGRRRPPVGLLGVLRVLPDADGFCWASDRAMKSRSNWSANSGGR
jgi:hypothetical protein